MQERELPRLPTHLHVLEQDEVLNQVNDRLSQCAYDFIAKYQFPIPLTHDARPVERPQDREWPEWVYLLKRLATKRRIPARVLYEGQIKQFVTVLENSLEMRHSSKQGVRPLKDDRHILQQISAGIQVAKILKDAQAMVGLLHSCYLLLSHVHFPSPSGGYDSDPAVSSYRHTFIFLLFIVVATVDSSTLTRLHRIS